MEACFRPAAAFAAISCLFVACINFSLTGKRTHSSHTAAFLNQKGACALGSCSSSKSEERRHNLYLPRREETKTEILYADFQPKHEEFTEPYIPTTETSLPPSELGNVDVIRTLGTLEPKFIFDGGKLRGIQLRRMPEGNIAEKLGLNAGDVIVAINGKSLNSPLEIPSLIAEAVSSEKSTIEYERDGQQRRIVVGSAEESEESRAEALSKRAPRTNASALNLVNNAQAFAELSKEHRNGAASIDGLGELVAKVTAGPEAAAQPGMVEMMSQMVNMWVDSEAQA